MGLRVNTNVQSLVAQRHLGVSNHKTQQSQEKLASGSRITRAADDAAGLAIAEKMKASIRSIKQDVRNAQDGISMIQTAEGGLNEVSNILIRMRELSIQAASDTIGDVERGFVDKEVQQLKDEVNRIALETQFNGRKLLSGEGEVLEFQIGLGNDPVADRFVFDTGKVTSTLDKLGLGGISTVTKGNSQENLGVVDAAINVLSDARSELGAMQNRLQSTISSLNIYDENLSTAKSRIYDVDVAHESSELVKNNILANAGVSVLSQANQNSMLSLKLLG